MSENINMQSMPGTASLRPGAHAAGRGHKSVWTRAVGALPNILVFGMLGGIFYFGHETGWKLPKRSAIAGNSTAAADDWCVEHLVPESICIECRTNLLPKTEPFGFCREHGVAECVIHHPELAQTKGEPRLPQYDTARAIALLPRSENNSRNTMHTSRVQFSSVASVDKAGVEIDVVQERPMRDVISANGELVFDPTRVGHLSAKVPGTVAAVFKTVGETVTAGQILGLVDATQVGQAKSQLLQAVVQLQLRRNTIERLRPISNSGAIAQQSVAEAEAAFEEAKVAVLSSRQALANLGFELPENLESRTAENLAGELRSLGIPTAMLTNLPAGTMTANLIVIRAPIDGVIVTSEVVAGEVVEPSRTLFTVSDPSRMWLMLNVRQEDAQYVRVGSPVHFRSDNTRQVTRGQVAWISPAVDERTRTVQVRVAVTNEDGALCDKTFGTGQIVLREEPNAIVVPRDAIQSVSDAHFVFVRDKSYFDEGSPKFFHVRQVRIGARDEQYVELLAGVLPGEVVATNGSNVLLAQLLRSNLGAGCGCHEQ